jgi:uncharacterized delta-60 repeat protein
LDQSFGALQPGYSFTGWVTTRFPAPPPYTLKASVQALAVAPDGKIVAAGWATNISPHTPVVARYNPDGSPDSLFGGVGADGKTSIPVGYDGSILAIAIQPDGKILAAVGKALCRLDATTGFLDVGFGSGGIATTQSGGIDVYHAAVAVQPDGRILAGGNLLGRFAIVRYGPDGTLDTGFGDGGITTADAGGARSFFLQPDGTFIVGATTTAGNLALLRFRADGTLDTGYGSGGILATDGGYGSGVALQPDGKILVAGSAYNPTLDFFVDRYNADATHDLGFGKGGRVLTDFSKGDDEAEALLLQPDGRIVVAGRTVRTGGAKPERHFALARYTPEGAVDHSFASNGKAETDFYADSTDRRNPQLQLESIVWALAIQPDGRLLAGGYFDRIAATSNASFIVARYY